MNTITLIASLLNVAWCSYVAVRTHRDVKRLKRKLTELKDRHEKNLALYHDIISFNGAQ